MDFKQEDILYIPGQLDKVIEYRSNGKLASLEKYGTQEMILFEKDEQFKNKWNRHILSTLNFNPILLGLINCYKIKVKQEFFVCDNKLVLRFKSPNYISNFFEFDEELVLEQEDDNIKVTRICDGKNKIGKWLVFPLSFTAPSLMAEVEKQYRQQQLDLIKEEIRSAHLPV